MGMTALLQRERPEVLVLLGDRGEMLAGAIAALHLGIVCAHIHGGERSGTVDEPVRHAISKLSHYHFTATAESKERLIRMGELPQAVHVTGAPGLDGLVESAAASANDVQIALDLPLNSPFVLAVFHPVVQQAEDAYAQTTQLLLALQKTDLPVVWMLPNSDAGSGQILQALTDIGLPPGSARVKHMDRGLFSAVMKHCAVMVGNSSAGIIEAASFATTVVNVGDRQHLRQKSANVMDVSADTDAIDTALAIALRDGKTPCDNVYGYGVAGLAISNLLKTLPLDASVLNKSNSY
jgi:GDP/UDP-N,N'-diacetylbacillosamine 2-epimerase (hydrolysing)